MDVGDEDAHLTKNKTVGPWKRAQVPTHKPIQFKQLEEEKVTPRKRKVKKNNHAKRAYRSQGVKSEGKLWLPPAGRGYANL
ncbi:unnamed protein product [Victoria cruziana]